MLYRNILFLKKYHENSNIKFPFLSVSINKNNFE